MESSASDVEFTSSTLRSSSSHMQSAFVLNSETQAERKPSDSQAKRKSTRSEEKRPVCVCEACMRPGHPDSLCPYRRSVKEGTPLAPGWKILCHRCRAENCHPGDRRVRRVIARIYCAKCVRLDDHNTRDCPFVEPEQKEIADNLLKMRQKTCDRRAHERMDRKLACEMENPKAPSK